ncbi:internal alternative NAD(P)H-ubiquinone oxidoreductase A1, mitochondrial-like [Oryza brachyantha]|uniref:internal alternative NAD(P)H-ubiquinone oxidoreductase A1, mitochondrial-like n=1 Tax=Oryza brachyantha TaxID=4533 RepID=UPI001ADD0A79|nr:internal alternative NAD(P)H-ubiquinone oxidoreductase A1, mitochondrial-like [Oryza brachyantha]XP_015694961.2 internal alternative NAD(P)H-ubiquinone oxidoreductase A1, mitochondrial-like [Oryza brachyantha]
MALSRIARGSQLTQSLSRIAAEGSAAATPAAYALRNAAVLGQRAPASSSQLHSLALAGLADKYAAAAVAAGRLQPGRGISTTPPALRPAATATTECSDADESAAVPDLGPTRPGEKPRVVVLGTGWAACRFLKDVDTRAYDVVCISPRNHMVFTPLLASTCVGTLEFRSVVEPVSRIQSALATRPGSYFFLASCSGIDTRRHEVYCTAADSDGLPANPYNFKVAYDKLVIASGSEPLTFGIKGVAENAIFLREVSHAQEIRRKLLTNLMLSENPGLSEEEKQRLLHCVVVGGGPTGVEFSGELSDFITRDVRERYTHVKDYVKVTLIEANEILSSFDVGLRQYATDHLSKYGVNLVRGVVKEVRPTEIELSDGSRVPYGLLVWSTGVGPSEFVRSLPFPKSPGGRIGVDGWLRVPSADDVFALGDCAGFLEGTGRPVLPALAQVAEREGKYLARVLSSVAAQGGGKAHCAGRAELGEPFVYKHVGSMASVGRYKALVDLRENKDASGVSMAGFVSWLMWRSAYLTRVVSWRNRFYVAVNWATTLVFGRDNTRIG